MCESPRLNLGGITGRLMAKIRKPAAPATERLTYQPPVEVATSEHPQS